MAHRSEENLERIREQYLDYSYSELLDEMKRVENAEHFSATRYRILSELLENAVDYNPHTAD